MSPKTTPNPFKHPTIRTADFESTPPHRYLVQKAKRCAANGASLDPLGSRGCEDPDTHLFVAYVWNTAKKYINSSWMLARHHEKIMNHFLGSGKRTAKHSFKPLDPGRWGKDRSKLPTHMGVISLRRGVTWLLEWIFGALNRLHLSQGRSTRWSLGMGKLPPLRGNPYFMGI